MVLFRLLVLVIFFHFVRCYYTHVLYLTLTVFHVVMRYVDLSTH